MLNHSLFRKEKRWYLVSGIWYNESSDRGKKLPVDRSGVVPAGFYVVRGEGMFAWGAAEVPLVEVRKMLAGPGRGHCYSLFTRQEMACCGGGSAVRSLERLAGRLAAKRAVLRALGLAADNPALWSTVEILPGPAGQPRVYLSKGTGRAIAGEGLTVQVSISHGERLAIAIAVVP